MSIFLNLLLLTFLQDAYYADCMNSNTFTGTLVIAGDSAFKIDDGRVFSANFVTKESQRDFANFVRGHDLRSGICLSLTVTANISDVKDYTERNVLWINNIDRIDVVDCNQLHN